MGEPLDARERAELCDLFLEVGPEAPTLCEGWTTLDLAAHLVVRERDPRAPLAIVGGRRFAGLGRRLMDGARARGYEALVEQLRAGPPLVPWRVPGLRTLLNANEWFVHHEDVRRAVGRGPRTDRPDLDDLAWRTVRRLGPLLLRRAKVRAALVAPGRGEVPARGDGPAVRVTGEPQELVLVLYGRRGAALVDLDGPPEAVAAFDQGRFGI
ncbi:MAG TPA: TIGR03085 family metal-binding protein [Acidimicrobiales bacterium]|nr:TIGR03085 family metal-binding protein [Acidimicrobiales bacterium]